MHSYQKIETASDDEAQYPVVLQRPSKVQLWSTRILGLLVLVLSFTLVWGWQCYEELRSSISSPGSDVHEIFSSQKSPYTGLGYDVEVPYTHHTKYTSHNLTEANEAWEGLSIDPMVIAPTKEEQASLGLPESWQFPWDSNRNIYFVKVFHQMHCLKVMRKTYHELWAGEEGSIPPGHIEHCLDTLRQDLMCKADDTPMPSLELLNGGGENQNMHCKNFDKLVEWTQAPERNACYKRLTDYKTIVHSIERYAFCPRDSEHYDTMDQYFKEHGHFADPFSEAMEQSQQKSAYLEEGSVKPESDSLSTPEIVDFVENDPLNPLNWSNTYKWFIVVLTALLSTIILVKLSLLSCGGPLSEQYGRQWVLHVANLLFFAFLVGTSLSTSIQMLIAFRFLSGSVTAINSIGSGIVKDLFTEDQCGRAVSVMSLTGAIGPVIGPIIGSYLGERAGWRWAFWFPTIVSGVLSVLLLAIYRETYKVTILKRKARRLALESGNENIRSKYDKADESTGKRLWSTAIRPLHLLFRFPLLALITFYISIVYGFVYLIMTTIAPVFQSQYGFSEGASGLSFLGLCLGLVCGALLCGWVLDRYIRFVKSRREGQEFDAEQRLAPVSFACLLMCGGFLVFGWTVHFHVQYVVPIIGTGMIGLTLAINSICVQAYIISSFGIYASSAVSAMLVLRNATAAFLPLVGPPHFR
ncbi:MFS multidrug transporter [Penicillium chermesinum]|uniref:MFS multidrug transporter n=1 Tax=Penicillium chermesinum TaxID=63820 RepID=A0A9W9P7M8_9EURO|nr:MFS multidrug transporter [Penicillium chermesinum]KAJ5239324.1 MFS multidrug transporter [Penicillium chermesinum]